VGPAKEFLRRTGGSPGAADPLMVLLTAGLMDCWRLMVGPFLTKDRPFAPEAIGTVQAGLGIARPPWPARCWGGVLFARLA